MNRPLCVAVLFLCVGILTGIYASSLVIWGLVVVTALGGALIVYHQTALPVLFVIAYVVGYQALVNSVTPPDAQLHAHILAGEQVVVTGTVHSYHHTRNSRQRIELRTYGGRDRLVGVSLLGSGEHFPVSLRIQAILPMGEQVHIGQQVSLTGRLNLPNPPAMPGGFNQERLLGARGISYTMFPRQVSQGEVTPSLNTGLQALRRRVLAVFEQTLPGEQAGIMQSMIMGDRQNIDDELMEAFRGAGLYHLLVVSGLHLSILMLSVTWLLGKVCSQRVSGVLGLGFIVLYALMIGGVSVTRASLMAGVGVLGGLLWRRRDFVTSIALAGMLILLQSPLFLVDAGFLLSFGSVLGIAFGVVPVERLLARLLGYHRLTIGWLKYPGVISSFATSIGISLTIMPLFSWFFFRTMTYGLLANMVVMATGHVVVVLGFLTGMVGLVSLPVATFLSGGLYFLLTLYLWVARTVYALPLSLFWTGRPSLWLVILYYLALVSFLAWFSQPRERTHWLKPVSLGSLVLWAVVAGLGTPTATQVTFLDQTNHPVAVVSVDGKHYLVSQTHRPDQGLARVQSYLDYRNIRAITPVTRIQFDYLGNDVDIGAVAYVNGHPLPMVHTTYRLHSSRGRLVLVALP